MQTPVPPAANAPPVPRRPLRAVADRLGPHFPARDTIRDLVIGMSDGLTVPFALAAGISGAVASNHIVVTAGLAEIAAGSIAMGLGGFLAARDERDHYWRERRRQEAGVAGGGEAQARGVTVALREYGIGDTEAGPVVAALRRQPEKWVDFVMRNGLGLHEPRQSRALVSALTIGLAYVVGGLVPLAPYMLIRGATAALLGSVVLTALALVVFGATKGRFTGAGVTRSAMQTLFIGGVAAAAAFELARLAG